jgi:hypothetical protein
MDAYSWSALNDRLAKEIATAMAAIEPAREKMAAAERAEAEARRKIAEFMNFFEPLATRAATRGTAPAPFLIREREDLDRAVRVAVNETNLARTGLSSAERCLADLCRSRDELAAMGVIDAGPVEIAA